jgi:hypothetical protein
LRGPSTDGGIHGLLRVAPPNTMWLNIYSGKGKAKTYPPESKLPRAELLELPGVAPLSLVIMVLGLLVSSLLMLITTSSSVSMRGTEGFGKPT